MGCLTRGKKRNKEWNLLTSASSGQKGVAGNNRTELRRKLRPDNDTPLQNLQVVFESSGSKIAEK